MQEPLPYELNNEYNITEIIEHFDSNYIYDIINTQLDTVNLYSSLPIPNIISSYENTFKSMLDRFPDDDNNIYTLRRQVYYDIIIILCERFNLQFNEDDENIDYYTAAYYLYDFLVCNKVNYMTNFFTSFIINNKDSIYDILINNPNINHKDNTQSAYGKILYDDPKYNIITTNIPTILQYIATLDISLYNIFQSIYTNNTIIDFINNCVADKGNFFISFYCNILNQQEYLPILIVNIILSLQRLVGNSTVQSIQNILSYNNISPSNNE